MAKGVLVMSNLTLIKSESFGQVQCDFWQNELNEILMTREQIGVALEYAEPRIAIANIHNRSSPNFCVKFPLARIRLNYHH